MKPLLILIVVSLLILFVTLGVSCPRNIQEVKESVAAINEEISEVVAEIREAGFITKEQELWLESRVNEVKKYNEYIQGVEATTFWDLVPIILKSVAGGVAVGSPISIILGITSMIAKRQRQALVHNIEGATIKTSDKETITLNSSVLRKLNINSGMKDFVRKERDTYRAMNPKAIQ